MLRDSDEVSAAAYLQVALRELIARAELVELGYSFEALARLDGDMHVVRIEEEGVGLVLAPPDAAAQLVHLRETELLRVVDDERVRGGDV